MSGALYQDEILAHARAPHGLGALEPCDALHTAVNRLCGDIVDVYLRRRGDGTLTVGFTAAGCALCRASASILMTLTSGVAPEAAQALVSSFIPRFSALDLPDDATGAPVGTEALFTIRAFPARTKCVLLPWQALAGALATLADLAPG